jgi:hypothetical protein
MGEGGLFTGFWLGGSKVRYHWEDIGVWWEDNIKMYLRETEIGGANWIWLTQNRVQWRAFVSTVMNFQVP